MEGGGGAAAANDDDASPTSGRREQPATTTPVSPFPSGRRAASDDTLLSQGDATTAVDRTLETALLLLSALRRQGMRDAAAREAQDHGLDDAHRNGLFGAAAAPASREAVASLQETTAAAEAECAVCLQSFEEGGRIRVMPCSHGFHEDCIVRWLGISRLCPLCRFALPARLQAEAGTD
jgi:hypothetical protein